MSLTSIRNLAFSLAFGLGCGLVFCALTLSGGPLAHSASPRRAHPRFFGFPLRLGPQGQSHAGKGPAGEERSAENAAENLALAGGPRGRPGSGVLQMRGLAGGLLRLVRGAFLEDRRNFVRSRASPRRGACRRLQRRLDLDGLGRGKVVRRRFRRRRPRPSSKADRRVSLPCCAAMLCGVAPASRSVARPRRLA